MLTPPPQLTKLFSKAKAEQKIWWQPYREHHEDAPDHKPNDTRTKPQSPIINGGDDEEGSASGLPYPSTSIEGRSNIHAPPASSSSSAALRKCLSSFLPSTISTPNYLST
jgi:hypothetical protein